MSQSRTPIRLAENKAVVVGDNILGRVPKGPSVVDGTFWIKATVAGTLFVRMISPKGTRYDDTTFQMIIAANTENHASLAGAGFGGEAAMEIVFNVAAPGVVNYMDWGAVENSR